MSHEQYRQEVREILEIIRDQNLKVCVQRAPETAFERYAKWLIAVGLFILLACSISNAIIETQSEFARLALTGLIVLAPLLWVVGSILLVIDLKRTISRPFQKHVDGILELLPHESELLAKFGRFNVDSLQMARDRLRLESVKVTSRLGLIGGEALKASLVGIGVLGYALLTAYRKFDPAAVSLSDLTFLGLALVIGFSIGGWLVKFGVSLSDYYSDLIGMAIEGKHREQGRSTRRWSRALLDRHRRRSP